MDITINELKTIKAKQLRRIIREAIHEVLTEDFAADKAAQDAKKIAVDKEITALQKKKIELSKGPESTLAEDNIKEMARIAKGFKLADPEIDSSQFANKKVSRISLEDIIDFFRDNPGAEKTALQQHFNFVRPQIANAVVNALLDSGVLVKLGKNGEVEEPTSPGERAPIKAQDPEDMFMGNASNPLSMYFDNEPNNDGSEDFNDEDEPTIDDKEIERSDVQPSSMSDDDYEAWMKYDDLKNRLEATKGNIIKLKRRKGGVAGDISDKASTELERLRDLKKSLEDRIETLVLNSDYLKKKVAKDNPIPSPKIELPSEEEETEDEIKENEENQLDEWTIKKLQHYAGIK